LGDIIVPGSTVESGSGLNPNLAVVLDLCGAKIGREALGVEGRVVLGDERLVT